MPSFDQEISIVIKTKNGEEINVKDLLTVYFSTEEGSEQIRQCIREELRAMIGDEDERH